MLPRGDVDTAAGEVQGRDKEAMVPMPASMHLRCLLQLTKSRKLDPNLPGLLQPEGEIQMPWARYGTTGTFCPCIICFAYGSDSVTFQQLPATDQ